MTSHCFPGTTSRASLVAQWERILLSMQETRVPFLGWEGPLKKKRATYSSILASEIPWSGEPDGLPSMGLHRIGTEGAV